MTRTDELRSSGVIDRTEARDLVTAHVGSDPWGRIQEIREAGKRKAKAQGVLYQLEHERKHVLAKLASEYAHTHSGQNLSETKLERLARADERYRRHVEGTAAAKEEAELANSEYWALRSELEWDRATLSHLNAMSRLEEPY